MNYYTKNNNCSFYYSLARQLPSSQHKSNQYTHSQYIPAQPQKTVQTFTFNKNFYPYRSKCINLDSAHKYPYHKYKYRSQSLPNKLLIRDIQRQNNPNFSYLEQIKKRQYIKAPKNYRSVTNLYEPLKQNNNPYQANVGQNKKYPQFLSNYVRQFNIATSNYIDNKQYQPNYNYAAQLNRFSKYDPSNKLPTKFAYNKIKDNYKQSVFQTNIRIQNRFNQYSNKRITSIKSTEEIRNQNVHNKQEQIPAINCNIQVKSDGQGKYYSTVQSNYPDLITYNNTIYDSQNKVLTTTAVFQQDLSKKDKEDNYFKQKGRQPESNKRKQTIFKNQANYDTYIVHNKTKSLPKQKSSASSTNRLKNQKPIISSFLVTATKDTLDKQAKSNQKITDINKSTQKKKTEQSPSKKRIVIEYQILSPKKVKSPQVGNKLATKNSPKQKKSQYNYSKYFLNSKQQKKQSNKGSIRKCQQNIKNQSPSNVPEKKRSVSGNKKISEQKTIRKNNEVLSPQIKKKQTKQNHKKVKNYQSQHLLTVKK